MSEPRSAASFDTKRVVDAVEKANLPTLLMVLVQLTGQEHWLEEPYRPKRARGLDDNDSGGLPVEIQQQIRDAAVLAIVSWSRGTPPTLPVPSQAQLGRMLDACVAEEVAVEYRPMAAYQMGFEVQEAVGVATKVGADGVRMTALVVGAGISGLLVAARLRDLGVDVTLLEKNQHVGGTWWENRYPGAGVDTPSYLYSSTYLRKNWSTYFAKRDEVEEYIQDIAAHYDLYEFIRFGSEVTSLTYDEAKCQWTALIRTPDGGCSAVTADIAVTAVGLHNRPKAPNIAGLDTFNGDVFHSAQWPDDADLTGKNVTIIGSGASAMQLVPAIVANDIELTIFQRSPQWIAPHDKYFSKIDKDVHWLMDNVPFYHGWYKFRLGWAFNDKIQAALRIDPNWHDLEHSVSEVNDLHREVFSAYLIDELADRPDLQLACLPTYPPYSKRILLDNGWFQALKRPNVRLVNDAIVRVETDGVVSSSGKLHPADVIVLATGFEEQRFLYPMQVTGRAGRSLSEEWGDDDARAYLGMTVPGFPNLFVMYGPNTNPGGGSYLFMAECQIHYLGDLVTQMLEARANAFECRQEPHDKYNVAVDEATSELVWTHPGTRNYYRNSHGRIVTNWPWRSVDYWNRTRKADMNDFLLYTRRA